MRRRCACGSLRTVSEPSALGSAAALPLLLMLLLPGCGSLAKAVDIADAVSHAGEKGKPLWVAGYTALPARPRPAFAAGAGVADITPPPGYPTGGHGPAGDVARGAWLPLRARAFFFEDRAGRSLTLVSAELFAIPAGLKARVAELVHARLVAESLDVSLPADSLILAATHTHQGPGNYLTARVHNQFGSTYPGFSRELFDFLAARIADAVTDAVRNARRHREAVELEVHVGRFGYDLLENRAPGTFVLNADRDALLERLNHGETAPPCTPDKREPNDGWDLPGCPRLRAVDRTLVVLRLARVAGAARTDIGALVFFAAHPTVLPAETPFYSPDFVGDAMMLLERRLGNPGSGEPVVVGFFNGGEGDVTARRKQRDLLEAMGYGRLVAEQVERAWRAPAERTLRDAAIAIRAGAPEPGSPEQRSCRLDGAEVQLAPRPQIGAAAFGGAEGDRTLLYDLGWRDGVRDRPTREQGVKLPALDSRILRGVNLSDHLAPPDAFPTRLPFVVAALGDFTLAAVPFELSTAETQAIHDRLSLPRGRLEIIGLANEYASYCATRDEYWAQDYLGASTLWGPSQGRYVECRLAELLARREGELALTVPGQRYFPGTAPIRPFGPSFDEGVSQPDDGLGDILRDRSRLPALGLPWFSWSEAPARGATPAQPAGREGRSVTIWTRSGDRWSPLGQPSAPRWPEDDRGDGFLTIHLGEDRWSALWLRPVATAIDGTFAFVVSGPMGTVCSAPFTVAGGSPGPGQVQAAASCAPYLGPEGGAAAR
jgi:neutral ceramidase